MGYDVIGDIHGQADELVALLRRMGYVSVSSVWKHPIHTAVFVGDLIDRGAKQVETVNIVRRMVEAGAALAVLGNHELNAIAWHTPDPENPGDYLRTRNRHKSGAKNRKQHSAFLAEVEQQPVLHKELVDWFLTLPLWLDLPEIRIVHACWHQSHMDYIAPHLKDARLPLALMSAATREPVNCEDKDTPEPTIFKVVEALTKGLEIPLPIGHTFADGDGFIRSRVRVRWWDSDAVTYRAAALLSVAECDALPDMPIPQAARLAYSQDKPLFFGHYWRTGKPAVLSDKVACVDFSAGKGHPLVAYRWNGEPVLTNENFMASR